MTVIDACSKTAARTEAGSSRTESVSIRYVISWRHMKSQLASLSRHLWLESAALLTTQEVITSHGDDFYATIQHPYGMI